MMAFAVLGLYLVRDLFPDQAVLFQSDELIKEHMGTIDKCTWADALASVIVHTADAVHYKSYAAFCIFTVSLIVMYFFWYRKLPSEKH